MSAAEVIALIKKLPPEERAEVIAFTRAEQCQEDGPEFLSQEEAERVAKKIFAENDELFRRLAQ